MDTSRMPENRRSQSEAAMSRNFDGSDSEEDEDEDDEASQRPLQEKMIKEDSEEYE